MQYKDAIILLRQKLLLSQQEFAKMLGVSFASVNRWEQGHHEPTYAARRKLMKLMKEYGIEVEW